MRRREFVTLLGGATAAWPLAARAQQGEQMRRIGVLSGLPEDDPQSKTRIATFLHELQRLGWTEGSNLRMEYRWGADNAADARGIAAELVALMPDAILAIGNVTMGPLMQATRTVPIVFTIVIDPVGAGFVESLSRPGGNTTGFMMFEYSLSGKWPELLKQIAPSVTRVAVIRDPASSAGIGQFAVIQSVASNIGMDVSAIDPRDVNEIEAAVAAFARYPNGSLIVTAGPVQVFHRDLIIKLAARYKLPTIYIERFFAEAGGLISYGPNLVEANRRAASYVARILKGEKPADLPVQAPTKYELVINLKTAKALNLNVLPSLLASADEVIE
jgi:putative ABC transport system substrate-binding protein